MRSQWLVLAGCGLVALAGCAGRRTGTAAAEHTAAVRGPGFRADVLHALRNDVNAAYGFRNGAPRINLGPCGRFARDFRERWNARFRDRVDIAFVMAGDGSQCHHVLLKLPDGSFYDGGNGIMTAAALAALYPGSRIDVMTRFDPALLDARSYGLSRSYPECPNYSDATTDRLIDQRLALLPADAPADDR